MPRYFGKILIYVEERNFIFNGNGRNQTVRGRWSEAFFSQMGGEFPGDRPAGVFYLKLRKRLQIRRCLRIKSTVRSRSILPNKRAEFSNAL